MAQCGVVNAAAEERRDGRREEVDIGENVGHFCKKEREVGEIGLWDIRIRC